MDMIKKTHRSLLRSFSILFLLVMFGGLPSFLDAEPLGPVNAAESNVEQQESYGITVSADRVNLRLGPGQEYPILGQVDKEEQLIVVAKKGDWTQIRWPRIFPVWIHKKYVRKTDEGYGHIVGNKVNVRMKPGTNYAVVTQFMDKQPLEIVGELDEWVSIHPDGDVTCWIFSEYLTDKVTLDWYYENKHQQQAEKLYEVLTARYDQFLIGQEGLLTLDVLKGEFEEVANRYPTTPWAKLSLEKSDDISRRLRAGDISRGGLRKKLSKRSSHNNLNVYTGVITDVGVIKGRLSSFKLVSDEGSVYYLTSRQGLNLADYPYGKVAIEGVLKESRKSLIPLLEVVDIRWLHE